MTLDPAVRLDPAVLAQLYDLLEAEALAIYRAKAHLFGLMPPDGDAVWEVDLSLPRFVQRIGDDIAVEGPVQLVGTWSTSDGTWLWGDHNPSIAAEGTGSLFTRLDEVAELQPLRSAARFELDERTASELATLCAMKTGWFAAWPGRVGVAVAWMAITPKIWPGTPRETVDRTWCTLCGRVRREAKKLIAGPGVMVCDTCVDTLAEIVGDRGTAAGAGEQVNPTMPPCIFCGERRPRIFGAYAAVCHQCTALCDDIVRSEA